MLKHTRSMRSRRAVGALLAAQVVAAGMALIAPSSAQAFASSGAGGWRHDRTGQLCGAYTVGGSLPYYWQHIRACNINFEKSSTTIGSGGYSAPATAAATRWNGIIDPDTQHADFAWVGSTTAPRQGYMGIGDLGSGDASGVTLGSTSTTSSRTNDYISEIVSATITMTNNAAADWYVNSGSTYTVPYGKADWQSVAVHELGHALGLSHPTRYAAVDVVMGACMARGTRLFNGRDDNGGLRWLYGYHNSNSWGSPVTAVSNGC